MRSTRDKEMDGSLHMSWKQLAIANFARVSFLPYAGNSGRYVFCRTNQAASKVAGIDLKLIKKAAHARKGTYTKILLCHSLLNQVVKGAALKVIRGCSRDLFKLVANHHCSPIFQILHLDGSQCHWWINSCLNASWPYLYQARPTELGLLDKISVCFLFLWQFGANFRQKKNTKTAILSHK